MKAFLLAAGHGTRLRPLTNSIPKCLVPIRGTPILEIWLEVCRRAGIDEVLVNAHAHADAVRKFLDAKKYGLEIRIFEEPVLLGSAGTISANRDWIAGESSFWILYGDVLTSADLTKMLDFHCSQRPVGTIGLYRAKNPSQCGVVSFDANFVVREFVEKPPQPKTNWAFSGLMIATPELLREIPPRCPVDLGFDVLPQLVGRMLAYPISDFLMDVGTLEQLQTAQDTWPGLPPQSRNASPLE